MHARSHLAVATQRLVPVNATSILRHGRSATVQHALAFDAAVPTVPLAADLLLHMRRYA